MYTIYKVLDEHDNVFVSYARGDGSDALDRFLVGGQRNDSDRRDVQFVEAAGGPSKLSVQLIETVENEWEALLRRNEIRLQDARSVTGPTYFPCGAYERAMKEQPERSEEIQRLATARNAKTAREAWALGLWTTDAVKALAKTHARDQLLHDLDNLDPVAFMQKYSELTVAV